MKKILLALSACAICCVPVLAQTPPPAGGPEKFVEVAAQTDMMEAHLGQLAADQAAKDEVKTFAQTIVADHTTDYQQLSTVAGKANLTVPKGLDAAHNKMIAPFEKLKGANFDHRYVQEMIAGHQKAILEYKRESESGENADIKAYANQALPVLQKHLQAAQDLQPAKGAKGAKSSK